MIKPFIIEKPYKCPNCGKLSLELFDVFGNKMSYPQMWTIYDSTGELPSSIYYKEPKEFRCSLCRHSYPITWINNGKFPIPMQVDTDLRIFKELFKKKP